MTPRIVLVTSPFPADSEGFVVEKFVALVDAGFDVHVLTSRIGAVDLHPGLVARWDHLRRRVHSLRPGDVARALGGVAPRPRLAARIIAHELRRGRPTDGRILHGLRLSGLRPDLVHFEFGWNAAQLSRAVAAIGCPSVVSIRGADVNYVGLDEPGFYDETWATVSAVHCLGEDLWVRAVARGCPPDARHVLIPPAVDVRRFQPTGRAGRRGPVRVISVGRLHWKKGHEYAVQSVAMALDQGADVVLRIVGEGAHRPAIRAAIDAFGLDERVELVGHLSREGIQAALQWADVFLHAAVSEGFCNAVMEAQAMELPVVTTDADGLGENVVHGETGFVVPRRDAAALATRLVELARAPDLRRRFGVAGRRRVATTFRPEDQIDAFVVLYRSLLGGSGVPR